MDKWTNGLIWGLVLGVLLGIEFTILSQLIFFNDNSEIEQLAQSICEEEYDMDYKSYSNGELKCKPKITANVSMYDGIVVKIMGE